MSNPQKASRRAFVKTAAAVTASTASTPYFIHAEDKTGTKKAVIGTGEYTYECIHDWGMDSLPEGHHYGGATHGTAIDSQGLIYITHHGGPTSIFVFDDKGKFVKGMGKEHVKGNSARGHGIDIRKEGNSEFLYLSPNDSSMPFTKMTLDGEVVWNKDRKAIEADHGQGIGRYCPTNVSFRPDGGYYLGDGYGSNFIFQYDKDDKYVRTLGGGGAENGKFQTPHGQWLDDRDGTPKLVVADRANKRLQWFDMEGKHLKTLDGFLFPADIDLRGEVLLVPDLHARITLLDKNDKVIVQLGDDEEWRPKALAGFKMRGQRDQWLPGKFIHPHDACFDKDGNIFVAEWVVTGRVTKLVKVG
ncbi:MAG: peptidase [Planctomycetota bacterium]|nr:peptidase [Planctomycetota bacterium]